MMMNRWTLDRKGFSNELNLMLALLRTAANPGMARLYEASPPANMNWPHFLELVRHHRVFPQVNARIRDIPWIPSDIRQAVHRDCSSNTLRMLRYSGEMQRVCRAMEQRGIRTLVLKGPTLALDLYGDVSLRTSKDLDILIPLSEIERAERLMTELGYKSDRNVLRVLGDWKWKVHHISYTHPITGIQVEIHWRLNAEMGKEPPFEELWERRRRSLLTPQPVYMPGREDLFLYLALHGARHGWFRLRWLADIDRVARLDPDGNRLIPFMRRYRCLHLGGQALALAAELFDTPIATGLQPLLTGTSRDLAQRAIPFIQETAIPSSEHSSKEADRTYKRYQFALKTKGQKVSFLTRRLYPSFRDAEALPLPRPLRFLYFPLRPFVWLWRQIREQA